MSDEFTPAISRIQAELEEKEQEILDMKRMINQLCQFAGKPPIYGDAELQKSVAHGAMRPDQFYGQPLAKAVRQVLEMRNAANTGPATVREIYETLKQGGFAFETKNEANAIRSLRISLSKNTALFHKLPNGQFGLLAWYPSIKAKRGKSPDGRQDEVAEDMNGDNGQNSDEAED